MTRSSDGSHSPREQALQTNGLAAPGMKQADADQDDIRCADAGEPANSSPRNVSMEEFQRIFRTGGDQVRMVPVTARTWMLILDIPVTIFQWTSRDTDINHPQFSAAAEPGVRGRTGSSGRRAAGLSQRLPLICPRRSGSS